MLNKKEITKINKKVNEMTEMEKRHDKLESEVKNILANVNPELPALIVSAKMKSDFKNFSKKVVPRTQPD